MFSIEKWREEDGAAAVEYGLLVGLIAVGIIASVTSIGTNIAIKFEQARCALEGKTWGPIQGDPNGGCP